MDPLKIEGTNISPRVSFDNTARILELSGYSRPENVRDFYMPLLQWIEDFKDSILQNKPENSDIEPITFKFKFIYFNSSSAKFIYDIILLLSNVQKEGIPIKIYWHFDEDDDELREAGEELSEMAHVPFFFVEINRN
ncbi:MAG TPA: DUF1987 domain-containing protein [Tenuifilaceae bacterium]|nr:DUF1987 domain-containing protein [Tenuifilaceae bacterium]HPE17579.1 DUF1987 domain-containing protein [Tenuifilaceae bacterium]HPJ45959.1 DUF1987 domain-containing protein [Tenuifilaceae bacterium]HPQ34303.1 DUF1987 domain-containing protein [Tenuifilaceae bacterium]HRX67971.1 DUF1987 domain-containing protein [Tenuifilaceae bacterium]